MWTLVTSAVVAVKALAGGAHSGKLTNWNGPGAISNQELAKRISKATGRTVKYVDIRNQRSASDARLGMPEWQVRHSGTSAVLQARRGAKTDGPAKGRLSNASREARSIPDGKMRGNFGIRPASA